MPETEDQNTQESLNQEPDESCEVKQKDSEEDQKSQSHENEDNIQLSVEDDEDMLMNEDRGDEHETSKDGEKKENTSDKKDNEAKSCASESENMENFEDPLQYIWLSNIDLEMKSEGVKELVSQFGEVLKVKMMLDYSYFEMIVCALVKMASKEDAEKALLEISKRNKPPHGISVKCLTQKDLNTKIELIKTAKAAKLKSKGNPDDDEEGIEEHKENGEEKDSKLSPKKSTRSVNPSRSYSTLRHHSSYSTLRGDRGPGGYGPRPFPPYYRRHSYRDPFLSSRRSFLYGWRDQQRQFFHDQLRKKEQMALKNEKWLLEQEKKKIYQKKLELLYMKKEISKQREEAEEMRLEKMRMTGVKRSYPKEGEWESRKKSTLTSHYEDIERRLEKYEEKYKKYDRFDVSPKRSSDWDKWPSKSADTQEHISPIHSSSSSHNIVGTSSYGGSGNYERGFLRHY